MKILKSFYLLFMCILLLITALILQTSYAIKNTAFSPVRYQQIFTTDESYKTFLKVATKDVNPELKQTIEESVDSSFYNKFTTDIIKGVFDFLDEKTTKLPVIDISALQDKAITSAVDKELAKQGAIVAKLDKNKIKAEVQKQVNIPTKIDFNEIANNQMDLANNKLDKEVITVYKSFKTLPTLAILIMVFIIIAIIIVAISPIHILRWLGATSLITGLFSLASNQATLAQNIVGNNSNELVNLLFTKLINQYLSIISTGTYIFISVGILLLAVSFIPALKQKSLNLINQMHNSSKYKAIKIGRIATATILTILIPITLFVFSLPVINAASNTSNGIVNTDKAK